MNKLLTTITLLCFSVAANADIYFCETYAYGHIGPTGWVDVRQDGKNLLDGGELETSYIITVDTDSGFRHSGYNMDDYLGSCEKKENLVICKRIFEDGDQTLSIAEYPFGINFLWSSVLFGDQASIQSGSCTKA